MGLAGFRTKLAAQFSRVGNLYLLISFAVGHFSKFISNNTQLLFLSVSNCGWTALRSAVQSPFSWAAVTVLYLKFALLFAALGFGRICKASYFSVALVPNAFIAVLFSSPYKPQLPSLLFLHLNRRMAVLVSCISVQVAPAGKV